MEVPSRSLGLTTRAGSSARHRIGRAGERERKGRGETGGGGRRWHVAGAWRRCRRPCWCRGDEGGSEERGGELEKGEDEETDVDVFFFFNNKPADVAGLSCHKIPSGLKRIPSDISL